MHKRKKMRESEFTKILFRFVKETDKTFYAVFCKAIEGYEKFEDDLTLYQNFQKHYDLSTPRDIIFSIGYFFKDDDFYTKYCTKFNELDSAWEKFYRKNKICSKYFKRNGNNYDEVLE